MEPEPWRLRVAAAKERRRLAPRPRLLPFICAVCGLEVPQVARGRRRRTCSDACRQKLYNRRRARRQAEVSEAEAAEWLELQGQRAQAAQDEPRAAGRHDWASWPDRGPGAV